MIMRGAPEYPAAGSSGDTVAGAVRLWAVTQQTLALGSGAA